MTILITMAYSLSKFPVERQALMQQVDHQGSSLIYALSKAAVGPILYDDLPALQTLAESMIEKDNNVAFIRVLLADEEKTLVTEEYSSMPHAPSRMYREEIRVDKNFLLGTVEIGILTAPTEALIHAHVWRMVTVLGMMILIKIITGYIVIDRTVRRPLQKLSNLAKQLGQGNLNTGITLPGRDELVLLANTLDDMRLNLKRSYDEIRFQNENMERIRENERKEIAIEIHDELGSLMTKLSMDLAWLRKHPPYLLEDFNVHLGEMYTSLQQINATVRRISRSMRPKVLDEFGLAAALEWLVKETNRYSRIVCHWAKPPSEIKLSENCRTALFRICQEALTNAIRHSEAKKVMVSLQQDEINVVLEVWDDGIGIDPKRLNGSDSFGIIGIRERALQYGGAFQIERRQEGGTWLRICLPISGKEVMKRI